MSDGPTLLAEARRAPDGESADRLALRALAAAPDLPEIYAFRAELALARGDVVATTHHLRVAYARGDRSAGTRHALAVCLSAAGQQELADRLREGEEAPAELWELDELARSQAAAVRLVLSGGLPPRGTPALLPTERPLEPAGAPTSRPASASTGDPVRSPSGAVPESPRPAPGPVGVPAAAEGPAADLGPRTRRVAPPPPDWLEMTAGPSLAPVETPTPDWLESASYALEGGGRRVGDGAIEPTEKLDLVVDPGVPEVTVRSPVTGQSVSPEDVARQRSGASMPELVLEDPLEAEGLFLGALPPGVEVSVAVELPGPVMTAPGAPPRTLCRRVALGVTPTEILLRDPERGPETTVRLPVSGVRRLDVLGDGQQLSLVLSDGRQVHLDLRALKRRTPRTAHRVVGALTRALEPPG